jgi:peptidoglycan hydrolase-like protein with peptidoglycan-binding domain
VANVIAPQGFKTTFSKGAITALAAQDVTQIQSALKNLGFYQGPVNGVADFATVGAMGQFQYSYGFGVQNNWDDQMYYALLTANHYAVNKLPAPYEFYQSQKLGAQATGLQLTQLTLDEPAAAPTQLPAPNVPGPGVGGGGPGAAPAPTAPNASRQRASDLIASTLRAWGFDDTQVNGLVDWAWQKIQGGASDAEITDTLYQTPEFKAAFPEYVARQQAGLPVSVSDILNYRQGFSDLVNYYGLNTVYNTADVKALTASLITGNVSLTEANDRIVKGFNEIQNNALPEAQQIFGQWYGPTSQAALAAYFLAPDHALPNLERQVQMAEVAGAGARFNFSVGQGLAGTLATQGVSQQQALQGFQQIDYLSPIFRETVSEQTDLTPLGTGVGAVFGTEAGAQGQLERRLGERKAALSGSGGAFVTEKGVVGLGSAS